MGKIPRQRFTKEFREQAARLCNAPQVSAQVTLLILRTLPELDNQELDEVFRDCKKRSIGR